MPHTRTKLTAATAPEPINEFVGKRVKKLRSQRHWSLEELASASGVSRSMLSEIERERANPTLGVAARIARAFHLTLQDFLHGAETVPARIQVISGSDPAQIFRHDADCTIRTLSPLHLEKEIELYHVTLNPGAALRSQPHFEGAREFVTVEKGRLLVESAGDRKELATTDSATYAADVPHALSNPWKATAVFILVVSYTSGYSR